MTEIIKSANPGLSRRLHSPLLQLGFDTKNRGFEKYKIWMVVIVRVEDEKAKAARGLSLRFGRQKERASFFALCLSPPSWE